MSKFQRADVLARIADKADDEKVSFEVGDLRALLTDDEPDVPVMNPIDLEPKLFTAQVAEELGINLRHLYRLILEDKAIPEPKDCLRDPRNARRMVRLWSRAEVENARQILAARHQPRNQKTGKYQKTE